jgi:small nuclear ribonucleoprotein (snRNP)-like protein
LSVAFRKFGEESIQFLGKKISIETSDKKTYSGTLIGINEKLDIIRFRN